MEDKITIHAIRLKPGQDLKIALQEFVENKNILAGWLMSCAGSLTEYHLRFANQQRGIRAHGFFEIIGLSGTLSVNGCHLHIALGDSKGALTGGHLLDGCIVYTTAEIIIGESHVLNFTREKDGTTQWEELQIKKSKD